MGFFEGFKAGFNKSMNEYKNSNEYKIKKEEYDAAKIEFKKAINECKKALSK